MVSVSLCTISRLGNYSRNVFANVNFTNKYVLTKDVRAHVIIKFHSVTEELILRTLPNSAKFAKISSLQKYCVIRYVHAVRLILTKCILIHYSHPYYEHTHTHTHWIPSGTQEFGGGVGLFGAGGRPV